MIVNTRRVNDKLNKLIGITLKNDDMNPHPDSEHFDMWLQKKAMNFDDQDWRIMKFVYNRAIEDGVIKSPTITR